MSLNIEKDSCLLNTTFFLIRRLILALTLVFLENYQTFQIDISVTVCLILLGYQLMQRPMKDNVFNNLESYSEITLMAITVLMISFSDYTPSEFSSREKETEARNLIGWVIIGITSIYIGFVIFFIIKTMFTGLKIKFKQLLDWCFSLRKARIASY